MTTTDINHPTFEKMLKANLFAECLAQYFKSVPDTIKYTSEANALSIPSSSKTFTDLTKTLTIQGETIIDYYKFVLVEHLQAVEEAENLRNLNKQLLQRLRSPPPKPELVTIHKATQVDDTNNSITESPIVKNCATQTCNVECSTPVGVKPHRKLSMHSTPHPSFDCSRNSLNSSVNHYSTKLVKIIIYQVEERFGLPDILQAISDSISGVIPPINVVKKNKVKNSNRFNYILEVPNDLAQHLTSHRRIKIKEQFFAVKRFIRVIRCYNCQNYNHIASSCTKNKICAWCSESHEAEEKCTRPPKCRNCVVNNRMHNHNFNSDHPSFSPVCESLKFYIMKVRLRLSTKRSFHESINNSTIC